MYAKVVKPLGDYAGAMLLAIMLAPIFFLIIAIYFLHGTTRIFFSQERTGLNGRPFQLYKFRSLNDTDLALKDRQFLLGKILRATSLDEIPQLINIILGDMSFIGPRPLPISYFRLMTKDQQKRYSVKPGITGWAQVNGRNSVSWSKKFELDLYYCQNLSFRFDLRILLETILLLVSFKKDVSLDEKPFTGNNEV